jgi:serine/threonine protein kinase
MSSAGHLGGDRIPGAALGTKLGEYRLIEYLGRGGMAEVYAALGPGLDGEPVRFAIKRFSSRRAPERRLMELFLHEAELSMRLAHPNVVGGIDFGVDDGVPYLVLELVDGVSCDTLRRQCGARLPARLAFHVIEQVLVGLAFVHQATDEHGRPLRVVHHDITPDNILLGRDGAVKISDFGVAHSALESPNTGTRLRGKLGYMAPEQVVGQPTDARSDLFSVGVVLADLLLGRRLFERGTELELLTRAYECTVGDGLADLRPALRELASPTLLRFLAREPRSRFQTATEAVAVVRSLAEQLGPPASSAELAQWLLDRELVRPESRGGTPSARAPDMPAKISMAPGQLVTAVPDGSQAPQPQSLPRANDSNTFFLMAPGRAVVERLSLTDLVERIVTGRVSREAMVSQQGQPMVPLHSFTSLSLLLRVPAYHFHETEGSRVRWTAKLSHLRLPSLLFDLASERVTGLLVCEAGSRCKRVFFEDGSPCFVASNDRSELFGQRFAAQHGLHRDELEHVVALSVRQGRRLGEVLVDTRLASAGFVLRSLVSHMEARLVSLGSWQEIAVSFYPGLRPGPKAPRPFGSPTAFPCRLVRECYSEAEVAAFVAELSREPLSVTGSPSLDELPLTGCERTVLGLVSQIPDTREIVRRLARARLSTPLSTQRALLLGLSSGALQSPLWTRDAGPGHFFREARASTR